jgi:hypothetical protein
LLLVWRLSMRSMTVGWYYGAGQATLSVFRAMFVSNFVHMAAAARALWTYRPGVTPVWDKTANLFPAAALRE